MKERQRHHKRSENHPKTDGTGRRRFLKAVPFVVGAVVAVPVYEQLREVFYTGEGDESFPLVGERMQGGEIVDDSELTRLYKEALESGRPLEPDPTIIRSTIHNAMLFFGTGREVAERRSQNVTFSGGGQRLEGCGGGAACVYDTSGGLGVEITQHLLNNEDVQQGWLDLLQSLAHEAYHLSVRRVDDRPGVEDFGVLGKFNLHKEIRGFWRFEEYQGEVGDLVNRRIINGNGSPTPTSIAEEFFAEVGKARYFKHLSALGLGDSEFIESTGYTTPYPFFRQGIVDVQDTQGVGTSMSWQEWWGGALDIERVDRLHFQSNRMQLFEGLGERILFLNPSPENEPLSKEDTAALGLVAYNDFIDYDLTNHKVISSLIDSPISPETIVADARTLLANIPEAYTFP